MILFDANLLVHAHARRSPFHEAAKHLIDQAADGELEACLAPQVLCEFFAVATNERLFKPALSPKEATREIIIYWTKSRFQRVVPHETTLERLLGLLERHPVTEQRIFDAFLVATMLDNKVRTIYTQNVKDFEAYPEIQVINPLGNLVPST